VSLGRILYGAGRHNSADQQRIAEGVIGAIPNGDTQVRDTATVIAHGILVRHPAGSVSVTDLNIQNRAAVIDALKDEERQSPDRSARAGKLLEELERSSLGPSPRVFTRGLHRKIAVLRNSTYAGRPGTDIFYPLLSCITLN